MSVRGAPPKATLPAQAFSKRDGIALASACVIHGCHQNGLLAGLRQLAPIAFIDSVAVQLSGLPFAPPLPVPVPVTATMTLGPNMSFDVVIPLGLRTLLRSFDTNADVRH